LKCNASNAAIRFYRKIRALGPRRTDLVLADIAKYANRAVALNNDKRETILVDLVRLVAGELACPACGDAGPHGTNGHHRVGRIRFSCSTCSTEFGVRDVG
jgi:transposase-like protein